MNEKVEIVAELKDLISNKFKEINASIDAMDSKLQGVNKSGGIMGQVLSANLLTGAITRAGSAFVDFAKDSFYAYGRQEQFQTALTTLLYGNTQQAEALNNQLKQFALETPFELTEIQDATKQMIAYGSHAGTVVDEMRMLGDISAGVKKPIGELVYLYGTLRTQGRAYTRDINQFLSAGINLLPTLTKNLKINQSQWKDYVEQGKVGFHDIERAFREMTDAGGQFHGMMDKQSKTLLGQVSNLSDAWDQLKAAVGKSQEGILKGTVDWVTKMVQEMNRSQQATNYMTGALSGLGEFGMNSQNGLKRIYGGEERDKLFAAYKTGSKEKMFFDTQRERDSFMDKIKQSKGEQERNKWNNETISPQMRLEGLSTDLSNQIQKLKPENAQEFMNKLTVMSRDIFGKSNTGKISDRFAGNELAIISKAMNDAKGIKGLGDDKKNQKDKEGKAPKDLETLAKSNRATQTIINIQTLAHLENHFVNQGFNKQQAEEMAKVAARVVSENLLAAVNDVSVLGQG